MSRKKREYQLPDKYKIREAKDMSLGEFSSWWALLNGLKFINTTSQLTGVTVEERDIPHSDLLAYIENVGGDIKTCIRESGGVPLKYSLSTSSEEAKSIDDLTFDFLY